MLNKLLEEYKEVTEYIINNMENDNIYLELMDKREILLKKIFESKYNKEEIKELYFKMNLQDLDKELKGKINNERLLVIKEINQLHSRRKANIAYEKNIRQNTIFNAKI